MSRTNNKRHMGMEPHVASSKSVIGVGKSLAVKCFESSKKIKKKK